MAQQPVDLKAVREHLNALKSTSKAFVDIWDSKVSPNFDQDLRDIIGYDCGYVLGNHPGKGSGTRVVEVMTPKELPGNTSNKIRSKILLYFAESKELQDTITVEFSIGHVGRAAGALASSQDADNELKKPRNCRKHSERLLGDSVSFEESDCAATLGPAIRLGGCNGWIVNWHMFHGIENWKELDNPYPVPRYGLFHPAYIDCNEDEGPLQIGELQAYSGRMYRTTRPSRSLGHFAPSVHGECKPTTQVVTDWAFCKAEQDEVHNCLRYAPSGIEVDDRSDPIPGAFVQRPQLQIIQTTGRSSGFRYAVVCETPAKVRQYPHMPTREWCLMNLGDLMLVEDWNSEGPGVCGDSGAAVVHDETGELIGQIWGRNVYEGHRQTPRVTYFTHHWDIFDDISERYPTLEGPSLILKPMCHPSNRANVGDGAPDPSNMEADERTLNPSRPRSRACSSTGGADRVVESFSQSTLAQSVTNSIGSGEGKAKKTYVGKALEGEMGCGHRDSHSRNAARTSADDDTDVLVMRRSSAMVTA
ncbi:hypothetical protein CPAR01_14438 [Colletotrichum paranaense]|uniref:Uncharacterized protein n=1 Tax=Colletotrichum paranaense TaxID=1914294 RepID=A0ABQ9S269_9PEZI|nr:uncharacterized protein CPAR01_14438 [Colletotrichum paranaense]KAK1522895.1 hypothetical protein CPAR01_14438 [Colletotrichum paranaense]